jgi:hypothetical protein
MMAENKKRKHEWWWAFLPIGLGLGTAAGALIGNVGLGLVIGAALGTPLNLIFYYQHKKSLHDSRI